MTEQIDSPEGFRVSISSLNTALLVSLMKLRETPLVFREPALPGVLFFHVRPQTGAYSCFKHVRSV